MDDKSHHFPRFSRHGPPLIQQNDSTEQRSSDTAEERPKKRKRASVGSGITCAPEQLTCRYANKKCLNPRAVKRTGGLHTFCSMHRANANRNQRRLDMRKRMARQALKVQQTNEAQAPLSLDANSLHPQAPLTPEVIVSISSPSGQDIDPRFEPLRSPTPLEEEDITTLISLFLPRS
ncbi:unnamed protein product [Peronospora belbahrii]|uniref:SCA7 domain-containing protein n=1 Tax=Peronospora belbahrii TaxID=622444 RepID=A0AAU9KRC5_9STRA|nr:unnamed protein product [Peronospora belbahrii]CAH0515665.1 unnamed protein product [Peronospora belbahrii]